MRFNSIHYSNAYRSYLCGAYSFSFACLRVKKSLLCFPTCLSFCFITLKMTDDVYNFGRKTILVIVIAVKREKRALRAKEIFTFIFELYQSERIKFFIFFLLLLFLKRHSIMKLRIFFSFYFVD